MKNLLKKIQGKQNGNQIGAFLAIALIVIMAVTLALTMNGPSLQGYLNLRNAAPVITSVQTNKINIPSKTPPNVNPGNMPSSPINIVSEKAGMTSIILSLSNAHLLSPQRYLATCWEASSENNFQIVYLDQPTLSAGQTVDVTVGSLKSNTAYVCQAGVATPASQPGAYVITRNSPNVNVTTLSNVMAKPAITNPNAGVSGKTYVGDFTSPVTVSFTLPAATARFVFLARIGGNTYYQPVLNGQLATPAQSDGWGGIPSGEDPSTIAWSASMNTNVFPKLATLPVGDSAYQHTFAVIACNSSVPVTSLPNTYTISSTASIPPGCAASNDFYIINKK